MSNIAISYERFSSAGQADGDSLRRQTESTVRYAAEHNLVIDKTLSFRDLGVSAYDRSNVQKGALGLFLKAVEDGRVPQGATLLIESLDRLSRAQVLDALQVFIQILNAGLTIVTVTDQQRYSRESVGDNFGQLMVSIGVMQRAHEESVMKSKRTLAAWKNKKVMAKANGTTMTRKTPHWIHADAQRSLSLIPERKAIVEQILDLAEQGIGNHTIIKKLNADGVAAWSNNGKWQPSYVQKLLHSPALYGAIDIDGDIVDGYYPPVIDRARFEYIKALRNDRATTKNTNRKGVGVTNLFSGLMKCGYCGSAMNIAGYKSLASGYERKYVGCHGARTAATECRMKVWFLDELEPALLFWLTNVDYAALMKVGTKSDLKAERQELASLEGQLADAKLRIERTMIAIEEGATGMVPRLKQHELDVARLSALAEKQRHRVTALEHQEGASTNRMKGLVVLFKALKTTTEDTERRLLREQLSALIATAVKQIVLYPTGHTMRGTKDDRFIDIVFNNGAGRRVEAGEC